MPLNITPKIVTFTSNKELAVGHDKTRRERVEDAATVTGGVGAGAAATRGSALKFFKSGDKFHAVVSGTARTAEAISQPAQQTKSLWNAFKFNYQQLKFDIAEWAKASKMPNFMKGIFTGKLGSVLGGGAALFVFISGLGEVAATFMKNVNRVGVQMSAYTRN